MSAQEASAESPLSSSHTGVEPSEGHTRHLATGFWTPAHPIHPTQNPVVVEEELEATSTSGRLVAERSILEALRVYSRAMIQIQTLQLEKLRRLSVVKRTLEELFGMREGRGGAEIWLFENYDTAIKGSIYDRPSDFCFISEAPHQLPLKKLGQLEIISSINKKRRKYWTKLTADGLCWYKSAAEPHMLTGWISLRDCSVVYSIESLDFRLESGGVDYIFHAAHSGARDEWIRLIRLQSETGRAEPSMQRSTLIIPLHSILSSRKVTLPNIGSLVEIKCLDEGTPSPGITTFHFAKSGHQPEATNSIALNALDPLRLGPPVWFEARKKRKQLQELYRSHQSKTDAATGVRWERVQATQSIGRIHRPCVERRASWVCVPTDSHSSQSTMFPNRRTPQHAAGALSKFEGLPTHAIEKAFKRLFACLEREDLITSFEGSLLRRNFVEGRFFHSSNYLCFLPNRWKEPFCMIVPLRSIWGIGEMKLDSSGRSQITVTVEGCKEFVVATSSATAFGDCLRVLRERTLVNNGQLWRSSQNTGSSGISFFSWSKLRLHSFAPACDVAFSPGLLRTVTCLTIGSRGDVQPYIALCKGLQRRGHCTRIASHEEYREWIEGHGIQFEPVGGDPTVLMNLCVERGMFTVGFIREAKRKFSPWLQELFQSAWKACQGTDLLIESPSAICGVHIAEALGIPYIRAFSMPWTQTGTYPHAFAVPQRRLGPLYNALTYTVLDRLFWEMTAPHVNRFRKGALKLEATRWGDFRRKEVPFLYNFSPSLVPPPLDWKENNQVTGYWFLEDGGPREQDCRVHEGRQKALQFIRHARSLDKKVVYIGFGSIVVADAEGLMRKVVSAVRASGVFAIVCKGWSTRKNASAVKHELSASTEDCILPVDMIEHAWLFDKIDAVCHHGGAGTCGAGLRAGLPTIILPFFGDQYFWADRVVTMGVGLRVGKHTSNHLAEALQIATTNERLIAKAKMLGRAIRKEDGVQTAIQAIYQHLSKRN